MKLLAIWCFILASFVHPQLHILSNEGTHMGISESKLPTDKATLKTHNEPTPTPDQYNLQSTYNRAIKSIKSSSNYLRLSENNSFKPVISCQQISWGIYTFFFEDQIRGVIGTKKPEFEKVQDEHLKENPLFRRLEASSNGKILISFSGVYDRIFFAEMTLLANSGDCQSSRPVLNEVYVYMFHIKDNNSVSLISVKRLD